MKISKELGLLKFKLFNDGVNVDESTLKYLNSNAYRVPSIVRTGASYGIEAIVNSTLHVNIPINNQSSIHISKSLDSLVKGDKSIGTVDILKHPISVALKKNDLIIQDVGKICFDRLGITLYTGCCFKEENKGCIFCGIDRTPSFHDCHLMNAHDILFVLNAAFNDLNSQQIKHVLLSGGVLPGEEYGAFVFAEAARIIKSLHPKISIYAMLPPPRNDSTLQMLINSGIDEIGLNIEIMHEDYRKRLIPGKERIGIERYFSALEYLSSRLPKFGARSILMGGIEPIQSTLRGVEELCKRGVMPIISHYRSTGAGLPSFINDGETMFDLWQAAVDIAEKHGTIIGPVCIPCQNNVIALPTGDSFRYY